MRYLKYMAMLAVLLVPLAYSQAQVRVGVGVVYGPGYVAGPPVCSYGYYDYYPYACAPYGYYGPSYFVNGVFIGAGPWYHGYWSRDWDRDRYWDRDGWRREGWGRGYRHDRDDYRGGYGRGYTRGDYGHAYRGRNAYRGGGEFHGRAEFRGGGRERR